MLVTMSQRSDDLRHQADHARLAAGVLSRRDLRQAALDIARGCDRDADEADAKLPQPANDAAD